jgi:predicted  nucleic acid-binding Zn-ribbon protein
MEKQTGKSITIDELAVMMNRSFSHLETKIDGVRDELKTEITDVKDELVEVNERLDIIEGKIINNHENRISRIEDDIRVIKTTLEK